MLLSTRPGQFSCSFAPAADVAPVADRTLAVTNAVRREAGTPTVEGNVVSVAGAGWPEASWGVAHAERFGLTQVVMDGWRWTPGAGWVTTPSAFALPLQLHLT